MAKRDGTILKNIIRNIVYKNKIKILTTYYLNINIARRTIIVITSAGQ